MALTRRSVIKRAGAAGSLLLAGEIPVWTGAEQRPASTAPGDYLGLSSALLGVEPTVLDTEARRGDPRLADTFYSLCREAAPAALDALLAAYGRAASGGSEPPAIAQQLLSDGRGPRPDAVGALARLTMLMWLYGIWYGGSETARMPASAGFIHPAHRTDVVVSVQAYRNAWIWRFAQARPMGVSGTPAAWSEAPPSLERFLTGA